MAFSTLQEILDLPKETWSTGADPKWDEVNDFVCNTKNSLKDRAAAIRHTHKCNVDVYDGPGVAGGTCESDRRAVYVYMNDN